MPRYRLLLPNDPDDRLRHVLWDELRSFAIPEFRYGLRQPIQIFGCFCLDLLQDISVSYNFDVDNWIVPSAGLIGCQSSSNVQSFSRCIDVEFGYLDSFKQEPLEQSGTNSGKNLCSVK